MPTEDMSVLHRRRLLQASMLLGGVNLAGRRMRHGLAADDPS